MRPSRCTTAACHLVGWRDAAGAVHVQDAFCPHLGAHLGHGGTVDDCEICCPFHGWRYDAEGANTAIPYSERQNRKARLRTYPTVERNGLVTSPGTTPTTRPRPGRSPRSRSFTGHPDWSDRHPDRATRSRPPVQEMAENAVDSAHFRYVHNTATVPSLEEYTTGFPDAVMRSSSEVPHAPGRDRGPASTTHAWGPGVSLVTFGGHRRHAQLHDDHARRGRPLPGAVPLRGARPWATRRPPRNVGKAFAAEVDKQVRGGQAHLGAQGPPRAPRSGRQRRPVHEVPQVDGPVLRRARRRRPRWCTRRRSGRTASTRPRPRPPRRRGPRRGSVESAPTRRSRGPSGLLRSSRSGNATGAPGSTAARSRRRHGAPWPGGPLRSGRETSARAPCRRRARGGR